MNSTGVGKVCPRMSVIFARGTGEPGNVGILTGPPFFAALAEYMNGTNQLAIQGVDYEAQPAGFFAGGSANGAAKMASLINTTLALCPSTPLLLSGYSQGAQLIHLATSSLPSTTTAKITSIVMFGDPKNGTAISGVDGRRVKTFCHEGDDICKGGDRVLRDHLTYSRDARGAAMWVMGSVADLGISSMRMGEVGIGI
ncbi:cutinase [Leptodontidium sp. 2 PMI_412]|nr:cutinase [Leptodontidium sp. 2 PMI_412]